MVGIFNFISQDDIDDLDDDPRIAFATLARLAQQRLVEQIAELDGRDEVEWERIEELRHSYMNVVVAAAKRFEIEPFISMQVPRYSEFRNKIDHREFQADLDHYLTQLMLDNRIRAKRDSVAILPKSKDNIRSYVFGLRKCIEQANMTEPKREALFKRLDEFEEELEKRRLNLLVVARIALEVLAVPGALWASADVANKLVTNIMQVVAEARMVEQETQKLAPTTSPKALSSPRAEEPSAGFGRSSRDDEIPF